MICNHRAWAALVNDERRALQAERFHLGGMLYICVYCICAGLAQVISAAHVTEMAAGGVGLIYPPAAVLSATARKMQQLRKDVLQLIESKATMQ